MNLRDINLIIPDGYKRYNICFLQTFQRCSKLDFTLNEYIVDELTWFIPPLDKYFIQRFFHKFDKARLPMLYSLPENPIHEIIEIRKIDSRNILYSVFCQYKHDRYHDWFIIKSQYLTKLKTIILEQNLIED